MTERMMSTMTALGVAAAMVASALGLGASAAGLPARGTAEGQAVKGAPAEKKAPAGATKPAGAPAKQAVPAARVAPMMKLAMPAAAFNVDAQVRQYVQQFRPILRAEYHVVRVACRLTAEQRKAIARDAEKVVREAARKYAEAMRRPLTVAQRAAADPRRQIREGLADAVEARLPGELAKRYRAEIARRDAAHKKLAVRNLVARMDRDLVLTHEQRDKVEASLEAHWDDSWSQSVEMFMQNNQFFPPIPDQYIAPFLNEPQKTIWRGTQKFYGFWGGFGMMGGIRIDDPLEDEELREARLEAARDDPKPDPNQPQPAMRIRERVLIRTAPAVAAPAPAAKAAGGKGMKDQMKKAAAPAGEKSAPKP